MPKRLWRYSGLPETVLKVSLCCALFSVKVFGTDYRMQVRLDPETRILQGSAQISWTNTSPVDVDKLCFHQYYNAWKNPDSSFLNSNRMTSRDFSSFREDEWAYSRINRLLLNTDAEATDRSGELLYRSAEDGNSLDETAAELPLEVLVAPGQSLAIELEFENRIPRTFARTGYRGDYFFIAQWFPKLGVLQDDGSWHCQQFIQTEFFADFGSYDVEIEVPAGWVVGATGLEEETRSSRDGFVTHRFRQEQVHDFAWTTSPDFQIVEGRFEQPGLKSVDLRLLLMPDHAAQADRYLRAVRAGLRYYGEWFGEYPYEQLTIVDPAYGSRTGGMEYPTLFTGGTRWWNPAGSGQPESVTVHEFGHQIWYGVVANNEFEDSWLDEGFNSYSQKRVLEEVYGRPRLVQRYFDGLVAYAFPDMETEWRTAVGSGSFYSELKWDLMATPSWRYGPASERYSTASPDPTRIYGSGAFGMNSYTKPALMLETLEGYLGWDVLQKILSTYFERFKFRHPRPEDFFEVAQELSGQDLQWFWKQTYFSSDVFDYAVDRVRTDETRQSVVIRRWGEAIFPIEVEVTFESGSQVVERWSGHERWKIFNYILDEDRIVSVQVDPEGQLALDINPLNNSWIARDSSRFAGHKWGLKWMIWLQNLLQQFAVVG